MYYKFTYIQTSYIYYTCTHKQLLLYHPDALHFQMPIFQVPHYPTSNKPLTKYA